MAIGLAENVKEKGIKPGLCDGCSYIFWNRMKYPKRKTEDKNEGEPTIRVL
jgi:hypothetical protein